ncbi:MAG TPA: D-2-hydroxyacid dehydrogenase [Candidatus Dormibacteraeota bacterium]
MEPRTNVLILLAFPQAIREQYRERLRAAFPGITIELVEHHDKVGPYIGDADVLITFGAHMADHVLAEGVRLRWVQALGTGVDGIVDSPSLRDGVIVTNLRGLHGPAVSECVLAGMLMLARGLRRSWQNQARATWQRFPVSLLKGKTVAIFGVGAIAEVLAPKCAALGMHVVGISSAQHDVAGFERMWPREQLVEAVADVDHLVVLTPLTAETHGIVNAAVLDAMKTTSFLINVARGAVVDEAALISALREGSIAGAALDVFSEEPLPSGHPFWTMENVLMTPHTAGFHVGYADDALPIVEENLRRFLAGDLAGLVNVVRT